VRETEKTPLQPTDNTDSYKEEKRSLVPDRISVLGNEKELHNVQLQETPLVPCAVALLVLWLPGTHGSKLDPMQALRNEPWRKGRQVRRNWLVQYPLLGLGAKITHAWDRSRGKGRVFSEHRIFSGFRERPLKICPSLKR